MTPIPQQTDGELLAHYVETGSQPAFTGLVQRHGPMVRGICWRVLGDTHEAEDVAQAVFLTLARKAPALRRDSSVSGWLHRVAVCLARNARLSRQSRQQREQKAMNDVAAGELSTVDRHAFQEEMDTVIDELPERYRQPLVLFHLQSKSLHETGELIGLNPNTLRTRLSRAREMLRQKLVRRGVTVGSVGVLTALLSAESGAAVLPATFVASTVSAATGTATVSASVAALTKGALKMLFITQVKTAALITAASVAVTGTGLVVAQQVAKPTTIAIKDSETTLPVLQLSEVVRLSRGPNGLRAEWISKISLAQLGQFKIANPPLECWASTSAGFADRFPGEFHIRGANMAEHDGTGIWRFNLRSHGDHVWVEAAYGTQSPNAWVEYIQTTNSARFIRSAWLNGKNELDPSQRVDIKAANFAELQAKMGDKLREYWAPVLALLTTQDLLGPGAGAGQGSKVFKPIDTTGSGTYGDEKWSYSYEVKGGHRQGFLKYDGREIGSPQPGDFLLTPWGWMHWQNSTWLPVPEKPAKGKQLPDPATHPEIISRPPPSP